MAIPNFPEFAPLSVAHKDEIEARTAALPAVSDITFSTLAIWWSFGEPVGVSDLRGNLIYDYHGVEDAKDKVLAIVGKNAIAETIDDVFEWQRLNSQPEVLKHVSSFVLDHIDVEKKPRYELIEEPDYDEYIYDTKGLSTLEGGNYGKLRRKVQRFERESDYKARVAMIDLDDLAMRADLLSNMHKWIEIYGSPNDGRGDEIKAMQKTLNLASSIGMEALGIYVGDELHGFAIYKPIPEKGEMILNHLRVQYSLPHIFDYGVREVAKVAQSKGIETLNLEMDLGIPGLKEHKRTLRPKGFYKKYTVTPLDVSKRNTVPTAVPSSFAIS